MQRKIQNRKVEDILTDERGLHAASTGMTAGNDDGQEQILLAAAILSVFRHCRKHPDMQQRVALGERIIRSIGAYERHRLLMRFSLAAGLLLLIGLPFLFTRYGSSDLLAYAENDSAGYGDNYTRLVLSGEEVKIASENSKIDYSPEGNAIQVDTAEHLNQPFEEGKTIFNTVVVPYGRRSRIRLSDQSVVWLNSGSRLVFPARFTKQNREVFLEGEGIFDITSDAAHPFHVLTKDLRVKVLGTVFSVTAYSDDSLTSTVLVEGSVELSYRGKTLFGKSGCRMVPGTLTSYNSVSRDISTSPVDTRQYTSWSDGYLIFNRQPLGQILKKISRYYHIGIRLEDPAFAGEPFSGSLDLKTSAGEVLQMVTEIIDAHIEMLGNQVLIKKN